MNNEILFFDMGSYGNGGIYSVRDNSYVYYVDIKEAKDRIINAIEIVSFCADVPRPIYCFDMSELLKHGDLSQGEFDAIHSRYTNMLYPCKKSGLCGITAMNTYKKVFKHDSPIGPFTKAGIATPDRNTLSEDDGYLDNIERDTYIHFKLWECWKEERLEQV